MWVHVLLHRHTHVYIYVHACMHFYFHCLRLDKRKTVAGDRGPWAWVSEDFLSLAPNIEIVKTRRMCESERTLLLPPEREKIPLPLACLAVRSCLNP